MYICLCVVGDSQEGNQDGDIGFCGYILWGLSLFLIVITFPVSLCLCIKVSLKHAANITISVLCS